MKFDGNNCVGPELLNGGLNITLKIAASLIFSGVNLVETGNLTEFFYEGIFIFIGLVR